MIDAPPVNALSLAIVAQLGDALRAFAAMPAQQALVVCAAGRTFVAGADVREFSDPEFQHAPFAALMQQIESLECPVVAALHGTVLGSGLELALACHARVALADTRLGLPEVLLGVLPGAGGTQRLPRLVPGDIALDLMLSGRQMGAAAALEAGLIDVIVEAGDVCAAAILHARTLASGGSKPRRTRDLPPRPPVSAEALDKALQEARTQRVAYPAPTRIAQCVEAALQLPFAQGMAVESHLFGECRRSVESAALRHLFFAQRAAARIPGLPADARPRAVQRVGVIGSGTMGAGIAMNFANAGIPTVVVDSDAQALARGMARIKANYDAAVTKGRLTQAQADQRVQLLQPSSDLDDVAQCDVVIEAVFENLDIKRKVCSDLGRICKTGAIIASNTSTLDIDLLADASGRPGDFLGLHFFSPANVMKLLEVIRGARTLADVLATAMQLAKVIAKVPVVSGVCYGFIGNRMLESYLREADFLLMEGASPAQIDQAIERQGLAMGPCRMLDMAGTDVAGKIVLERGKAGALPADPAYRAVVVKLLEANRHGQKTGMGYYRYEGRTPTADPAFEALSVALAKEHGTTRRAAISDQEIVERCLYPLISEGARIVEEAIAYRAGDVDVVWTQGYGFPDYRGGPLFMADAIGLRAICDALDRYAAARGDAHGYWSVSPLLRRLADTGGRLSDQLAPTI